MIYYLIYKNQEKYKNKYTSYLTNLFIIFVSLFISIVLIETYLHLAHPSFLGLRYSITGELDDLRHLGFIKDNTFNMPANTFCILGLGDSFNMCDYGEHKNYLNFLEKALRAEGRQIDIVNAGLGGIGPGYYWHVLQNYGNLWKPDLVLVGFFLGNDFGEMDFDRVHFGSFIREPRDPVRRWLGYLRFKNFWLYQTGKGYLTIFLENRKRRVEREDGQLQKTGSCSRQTFLGIEKGVIWIFTKDKQTRLKGLWQDKAKLLLKFKGWCDQRKIPLIIAIFPDQFQVDGKLRQEIYQTYHLAVDDFDLAYPNRLITDYCRDHGIHCLDMLVPFQKSGASQDLYRLQDTHWNEAGNRLAAGLIFDYLTQNGILRPQ